MLDIIFILINTYLFKIFLGPASSHDDSGAPSNYWPVGTFALARRNTMECGANY